MNYEQSMGVDPKIKKEINKEGFEDNAAVLIGKKEEMPQLLERLEKGGRAENLGTYIKMHKEIVVPKEEMSNMASGLKSGLAYFPDGDTLFYIDKEGNIANVEIHHEKIASFRDKLGPSCTIPELINELKDLGFEISGVPSPTWFSTVFREIEEYKKKLEKKMAEKKKENFDF